MPDRAPRASATPGTVGAIAGAGALRRDVGAAAGALHEILDFLRRPRGRRLAPRELLAHASPDRVHPAHIAKAEPKGRDDEAEKHEFGEREGEHALRSARERELGS